MCYTFCAATEWRDDCWKGAVPRQADTFRRQHDDSTASATETIVPWLIKNGYQIVTVTELMDAKGVTMQNGTAYYSVK